MILGRVATILCVAVVAGATISILTDEGIANAPSKVLGAGLIASGLVALFNRS